MSEKRSAADGPEGTPPFVDWAAALRTAYGDANLLNELAQLFLQEAPRLLAELTTAVAAADTAAVRRAAHTLKGQAAVFAAEAPRRIALAVERAAAAGTVPPPESLRELETLFDRLQTEVRSRVPG